MKRDVTVPIHARVPQYVKDNLEAKAAARGQTVSGYICYLLKNIKPCTHDAAPGDWSFCPVCGDAL